MQKVTMNRISIGIIGAGNIVKTMHLPILYNIPSVKVRYIADLIDKSSLSSAFNAQFIKLDKSSMSNLPTTDAVFIATPLGVRQNYYDDPNVGNSCILTEKPFVTTIEQHKQLITRHRNVMCNYNRRFYASIGTLKKIIENSLLGKLREVTIAESAMQRGTGKSAAHYQFNKKLSGGGLLIERGCHTLSQVDVLFSDLTINLIDCKIEALNGFDIDIDLTLEVCYNNNLCLPVTYKLSAGRLFKTLSVYRFDNGKIQFDQTDASSQICIKDNSGNTHILKPEKKLAASEIQSFYLSWISFIDKLGDRDEFIPEVDTSIRTTEIIDSVYRKAGLL